MNVNKSTSAQILTTLRTTLELAQYGEFNFQLNRSVVTSMLHDVIRVLERDVNNNPTIILMTKGDKLFWCIIIALLSIYYTAVNYHAIHGRPTKQSTHTPNRGT